MRSARLPVLLIPLASALAGCGQATPAKPAPAANAAPRPDPENDAPAPAAADNPLPVANHPFGADLPGSGRSAAGKTPEPVTWADVGEKPAALDGLELRLAKAEYRDMGGAVALTVSLWAKNTKKEGPVKLKGYGYDLKTAEELVGHKVENPPGESVPIKGVTLEDDAGNTYRPVWRFLVAPPRPDTTREHSIGPGQEAGIGLVFEPPAKAAKELKLTIPGVDVGLAEPVRLKFPTAKVAAAKKK